MFEEVSFGVFVRSGEKAWTQIAGPIQHGAMLVRKRARSGYQELCVLTIEGASVVRGCYEKAIKCSEEYSQSLEQRIKELQNGTLSTEAKGGQPAIESLKKKLKQRSAIHERILEHQHDLSWGLQLMEHPTEVAAKEPAWIVKELIALHCENGSSDNFNTQAQIVLDILRPGPSRTTTAQAKPPTGS
jgi:hypothetical protein